MAAIYLKHERHGTKVACSAEEAKYDESNGWKRYEVAMVEKAPKPEPEEEDSKTWAERAGLVDKYVERFGKKPHHKKTVETLKAELEAA